MWCSLAIVALGYLTVMAVKPELLAHYAPSTPGGHSSEVAQAEIRSLRDGLIEVQTDVSTLKSELATQSERFAELGSRVGALADVKRAEPASAAVAPAVPISPAADARPAMPELRAADPAPEVKPVKAASNSATPTVINAAQPADVAAAKPVAPVAPDSKLAAAAPAANLETGSVEKPVSLGQAVVKPADKPTDKPVGIKIATGSSLEAIRLSWNLLAERHADSLKNLEPRYRTGVDADGLTYELLAGPVKNVAEAKKMCKAFTAKAIPCQIAGPFGGEAL